MVGPIRIVVPLLIGSSSTTSDSGDDVDVKQIFNRNRCGGTSLALSSRSPLCSAPRVRRKCKCDDRHTSRKRNAQKRSVPHAHLPPRNEVQNEPKVFRPDRVDGRARPKPFPFRRGHQGIPRRRQPQLPFPPFAHGLGPKRSGSILLGLFQRQLPGAPYRRSPRTKKSLREDSLEASPRAVR